MKKTTAWYLAMFFLLFGAGALIGQEEKSDKPQRQTIMAKLSPGDVALSVYGEDLTWAELQDYMKRDGVPLEKRADGTFMPAPIQSYVQRMSKNAVALHIAKEQGYVLSDAERAYYLDGIKKPLKENNVSDAEIEKILARYPKEGKGLFNPSLEDVLMIAKLQTKLVENVKVTDEEVEEELNRIKAGNIAVEAFNKQMRKTLAELLAKPEAKTDQGFANLAKEYSEGKEAEDGGVIEGDFPRSFVAAACEIDEFELKAGETSGILESGTAFRALRVLKVLPPKKEGGEERVQIAQIILPKYPVNDELPTEKLREKLLPTKKMKTMEDFVMAQMSKARFSCPLFPQGLMEDKKEKAE